MTSRNAGAPAGRWNRLGLLASLAAAWLPGGLTAASQPASGEPGGPAAGPTPAAAAEVKIAQAPGGDWRIAADGYDATVGKDGLLCSLKVGGVETIGDPFSYQPRARLAAVGITPDGATLKVALKGQGQAKGEATIDYHFRPDGLTIEPTWQGDGYADFRLVASPALLGIELLNDKSVTGAGDSMRFTQRGEVRGVPAVPSARNQMVRFHFPSLALRAYVQAWGAPYNYESAGGIRDRSWGRGLMAAKKPFPIVLAIERRADRADLPAVVFVPRTDKVCSLYHHDEPCTWTIDLGDRKAWRYLLDAGIRSLKLAWRLTDVGDLPCGEGNQVIALDAADQRLQAPLTIKPPGSGYFQALFELSEPSGRMLPSSFLTRFTVMNRMAGLAGRDDSLVGREPSDYAIVAMIGAGCIRESHDVGGFFSDKEQKAPDWQPVPGAQPPAWMNVKALDRIFDRADAESRRCGVRWFFQANGRPKYAIPPLYEAMACALVSRYKDRCRIWEVENEPHFRYSPADYVNQCLVPFHKGAKRADPSCVVMGPAGCGVNNTLHFMEHIYAVGASKYLDHISTHTYPGPGESWEQFGNLRTIGLLREWMAAHGDGGKVLWQTEQGYRWELPPKGQAARYAVRQFLQGWRLGIEPDRQYYFYPRSHGFESWYQVGGGEEGSRDSWLPVAAAQRFFAENTRGRKYAGDLPAPYKGIYLSRFDGAAGDVVAAWTFDFPFGLAVRPAGVRRIVDWMGNGQVFRPGPPGPPGPPGALNIPICGEPTYIHLDRGGKLEVLNPPFGPNLAAAASGAKASASSADPKHPPELAIDGNWNLWETVATLPGRTAWISAREDPSPKDPDWLEVRLAAPRKISRIVALCYLPAVNPSPRDFEFQVERDGKWVTVAAGRDQFEWVLYREFPPVTTAAIRMVVTRINDGWHGDRRWMHVLMGPKAKNYTDSKLRISELEAYGPESRG